MAFGQPGSYESKKNVLVLRRAIPGNLLQIDHSTSTFVLRVQLGLSVLANYTRRLLGLLSTSGQLGKGKHGHHNLAEFDRVFDARGRVDAAHE